MTISVTDQCRTTWVYQRKHQWREGLLQQGAMLSPPIQAAKGAVVPTSTASDDLAPTNAGPRLISAPTYAGRRGKYRRTFDRGRISSVKAGRALTHLEMDEKWAIGNLIPGGGQGRGHLWKAARACFHLSERPVKRSPNIELIRTSCAGSSGAEHY